MPAGPSSERDAPLARAGHGQQALELAHLGFALHECGQGGGRLRARRRDRRRRRGRRRRGGDRALAWCDEALVQGTELRPGRRPELVAQEGAHVLEGQHRLGDVAAGLQHADQRHAGRLAIRRRGDRGACVGLRARELRAPGASAAPAASSSAWTRRSSTAARGASSHGAS